MFVELIESLRCPNPHEPSGLVVSATRIIDRHIADGTLGCPVCSAEFVIADGVARFGTPAGRAANGAPSDEEAMRLAAFLELTDARGFALLCGAWAVHAERLRRITDAPLVFVNAPANAPRDMAAAVLEIGDVLPIADGAARAAALDGRFAASHAADVARAVRLRGRVVGPASLALPAGVAELTRDARAWVGERVGAGDTTPVIQLARGTGAKR